MRGSSRSRPFLLSTRCLFVPRYSTSLLRPSTTADGVPRSRAAHAPAIAGVLADCGPCGVEVRVGHPWQFGQYVLDGHGNGALCEVHGREDDFALRVEDRTQGPVSTPAPAASSPRRGTAAWVPSCPVERSDKLVPVRRQQAECRHEHETGDWSGRRDSNPRHSAWEAARSRRCDTTLRGRSERAIVRVSCRAGLGVTSGLSGTPHDRNVLALAGVRDAGPIPLDTPALVSGYSAGSAGIGGISPGKRTPSTSQLAGRVGSQMVIADSPSYPSSPV